MHECCACYAPAAVFELRSLCRFGPGTYCHCPCALIPFFLGTPALALLGRVLLKPFDYRPRLPAGSGYGSRPWFCVTEPLPRWATSGFRRVAYLSKKREKPAQTEDADAARCATGLSFSPVCLVLSTPFTNIGYRETEKKKEKNYKITLFFTFIFRELRSFLLGLTT